MKYYIIAGEASGDLHGSNLMKELKKLDSNAEFRFWGGDLMQKQGGTLVKHFKDLAFMGFLEVIKNLGTILKNIKFCKKDILNFNPDRLIFIDYPGFNLRIAKFAKEHKINTHYYISPQLWAWKSSRVHQIKRDIDRMYVILPFEKQWYEKHNYKVDFVGHPLLDAIENFPEFDKNKFKEDNSLNSNPIIALLPGSRIQEIEKMLTIMLSIKDDFPNYQFVIAGAPSIPKEVYEKYTNNQVKLVQNQTYKLLKLATSALVTSGTATLETALFDVPEVVCYKGSEISYQIGKRLIKHIKYISLVNLILNREVVKELIQNELTTKNLTLELNKILDESHSKKIKSDYKELKSALGGSGASKRTAELIFKAN
ncbi:MAG: lipid-A-disaccharide synthase [Flavobacteriales bacterium]|nr:lipid-A-disaccharide synthase [Flavobacteriales bacterium]